MLTPRDVALVNDSFARVAPIRDAAADIFYARLFQLDPSTEPLFHGTDMQAQGEKLMDSLALIAAGLSDLDRLLPVARALAARHVGYGVRPAHYRAVGAALIYALEKGLGPLFDAPTRSAWLAAYELLSQAMIEAAEEVVAAR